MVRIQNNIKIVQDYIANLIDHVPELVEGVVNVLYADPEND